MLNPRLHGLAKSRESHPHNPAYLLEPCGAFRDRGPRFPPRGTVPSPSRFFHRSLLKEDSCNHLHKWKEVPRSCSQNSLRTNPTLTTKTSPGPSAWTPSLTSSSPGSTGRGNRSWTSSTAPFKCPG